MFKTTLKLIFILYPVLASPQYSPQLETALKKAGNNRPELERALKYCSGKKNELKLKAMEFLITNMDIHYTSDYYWENPSGQKIEYSELEYPDFEQAKDAFAKLKEQNPGIKPKSVSFKDIETIKADFLIKNVESAYKAWQGTVLKNISFTDFCEYILPYRIDVEPLQEWRSTYSEKFKWINKEMSSKEFSQVLPYLKDDYDKWFTNTWGEQRKEPLPRLSALQLLQRKQGPCPDIADLGVFIMRSQGIPATVNVIPFWATSTGGHFMNTFFGNQMKEHYCDYGAKSFDAKLQREPAKVLRITYSKNPNTLASFEASNNIPPGILQQENYIDVTKDFWDTRDVKCSLYQTHNQSKIVYATTFNSLIWQPFWWGKIINNETVFTSLCKETVIIPQYFINGKLAPAGPPVVIGSNDNKVLIADLNQRRDIVLAEKEKYLKFKIGVSYKLFYWQDGWKIAGTQNVAAALSELRFEKVPKNALLLLVASDSKHLERPFTVGDDGSRTWY